MTSSADMKKLNREQLQAIRHGTGPLLIIAGAGTGKTTVITERIVHLIKEKEVNPRNILALTFTEKASQEMIERVDVAMPYGYTQMWISTFHSFCDRILRAESFHIGLDPRYRLMTEAETVQFIRKHLFDFNLKYFRPLGNPTKFISGMMQHFSRLQDEDILPEQYMDWVKKEAKESKNKNPEQEMELDKWNELSNAYRKYEDLKVKEGKMDYGDLIVKTLALFRERPNILKTYREQFKYILVDEFQDTNIAQYELIKLLAPTQNANITVVGDDSQCLPGDAKITTPEGVKRIKDFKKGDKVLTAVGKGHTSVSQVTKVFKRKRRARVLSLRTEDGRELKVTDNHKLFCFLPAFYKSKDWHFVYLMHQENLGWRIGVTNNLPARLRLEHHADRIFALGSFTTDQEARFQEAYLSAKYGLPTVPFSARPNQAISGVWLEKLFRDIDTNIHAKKLADDFGLDLSAPVFAVDGITRGVSKRVKVNLNMNYRYYRSKTSKDGFVGNPAVMHLIHLETSNNDVIAKLEASGFSMQKAKKGKRIRISTTSLLEAWNIAEKLATITGGIIDKKFAVGKFNYQHLRSRIVPASHVFEGMYLPVLVDKHIEYKMVVARTESVQELETYDLEVEKTHNFIANGIVVHNSIYKFRGAAISNILHFRDDYENAKTIVLTKNYRSTQAILDYSYKLIQHNNPDTLESQLGITKNLISSKKSYGDPITFIHKDRVENEAEEVAKQIELLVTSNQPPVRYGDVAILIRANNHADPFIRAFQRHGIPYQFLGPGKLFRQSEIVDLISYLKVLYDFEDSVSFYKLLAIDHFQIPARDLIKVTNTAKKLNKSLFEMCEEVEGLEISDETKEKITKIVGMVHRHMNLVKSETAGQILYYFLIDTDLLQELLSPDNPQSEKRAANIGKFFDKLKTHEVEHEDSGVTAVVDWIDLSMELGESPLSMDTDWSRINAVNILTVHGSKGLEFPVVFLVNLVGQRFPTIERREQIPIPDSLIKETLPTGDFHMQEERRLFYVGMTRAKYRLFLTAADYYGEAKREKKLSPFIYEALGDSAEGREHTTQNAGVQLSFLDYVPHLISNEQITMNHEPFSIDYLSYSQIECFQTCPLHYKLRYHMKVPTPPSAALSFGSTMHAVMHDLYSHAKNGKDIQEEICKELLDTHWIRGGYTTKAHEAELKDTGYRYLKEYLEKEFKKELLPAALEQPFTITLPAKDGERPLKIGGKMDRVDLHSDGTLEIIDYKTGKIPTQKEVDKNMQLTFYALAAHFLKDEPFARKPEQVKLSLYYFDEQKKMSTTRTMDQLLECVDKIYKLRKEIEASDFKCQHHMLCDNCEYSIFCKIDLAASL